MMLIDIDIPEPRGDELWFWLAREYKQAIPMSIVPPQQLHFRVLGPEYSESGPPPLVFLHGLMGFAANWGKIWPQFEQKRPILLLDQRGHGRSSKPPTGYAPEDYAGDLKGLIDRLGWRKCHVVGHSMGGRVALRFCSRYPGNSRSLILEDSGMEGRPLRLNWIHDLLNGIPTPFSDRESAKRFFASHFTDDPLTGGFLFTNLEPKPDGTLDWRFYKPGMTATIENGRAQSAMQEFSSLSLPTLVIRGSRSSEFPKDEAERMAAARPDARLVTIEGAGHFVHAEKPEEFSRALAVFLQAVEKT
jgi:pimeloyl-ACP methyl ester carboxylesterase